MSNIGSGLYQCNKYSNTKTCMIRQKKNLGIPQLNYLEKKVLDVYEKNGYICKRCKTECPKRYSSLEIHGPLSFFNIGNSFAEDKYKILFVGKNTWYNQKDVNNTKIFGTSSFKDCREQGRQMFRDGTSRFWTIIKQITQQLYPEDITDHGKLWNHIALTNLTRCNTSQDSYDTTPYYFTEQCIKFFEEEVKNIKPKHLVLFTSMSYDPYIEKLHFGYSNSPKNITEQANRNGNMCWWERKFSDTNRDSMFFLRTRHPVRAPSQIVSEIVNWIRNTS